MNHRPTDGARSWHERQVGDVIDALSRPEGLTNAEARERLAAYGPNPVAEARPRSEFMTAVGLASVIFIAVEFEKWLKRRRCERGGSAEAGVVRGMP